MIFEGVPEVLDLKREVFARISKLAAPSPSSPPRPPPFWSTTCRLPWIVRNAFSTPTGSTRRSLFRWSSCRPARAPIPPSTDRLKSLLEGIGKVPVVCAARPGYIVPRIQALAMNEAARMVEEGVASAEDIDKAIKYGFGIRYANLGMLEFIDYGGGDILYYASRYLTQALGDSATPRPRSSSATCAEGRIGLKTGKGFLDYSKLDIEAYRTEPPEGAGRHAGLHGPVAAAGVAGVAWNKKAGQRADLNSRGRRRFAHPAGRAELALTWRTMALVVAPQEHPFEIGLGSKREAGLWAQRTCRHATPVTEALHVPLHRQVELGCSHAATANNDLAPGGLARRFLSRWLCLAVSSGSGWVRDWCAGHSIRKFLTAVPSMSASPSVILYACSHACPRLGASDPCPGVSL